MKHVSKDLCHDYESLYELEHDVHSYIGQETKHLKQISTSINVGNRLVSVPLMVDDKMNISYEVPGMNQIIEKLKLESIRLVDEVFMKAEVINLLK